jgi:hypothetical protein
MNHFKIARLCVGGFIMVVWLIAHTLHYPDCWICMTERCLLGCIGVGVVFLWKSGLKWLFILAPWVGVVLSIVQLYEMHRIIPGICMLHKSCQPACWLTIPMPYWSFFVFLSLGIALLWLISFEKRRYS